MYLKAAGIFLVTTPGPIFRSAKMVYFSAARRRRSTFIEFQNVATEVTLLEILHQSANTIVSVLSIAEMWQRPPGQAHTARLQTLP